MRYLVLLGLVFLPLLSSCNSMYFSALEKIGIEKRDLFIKRIKAARNSQVDAKEQFKNALEEYKSVVNVEGGDLESKYSKLSAILDESEKSAEDVKTRVIKVRDVAVSLFQEWKSELSDYSNQELRRDSEKKLDKAKMEYAAMMASMKIASDRLEPALKPLRDNVLYLKHNLNAKAIMALNAEVIRVEEKVDNLIEELSRSIADADEYVKRMESAE
jgi:hypothetical protein